MVSYNDTILITGSNGFVGQSLVPRLHQQGYKYIIPTTKKYLNLENEHHTQYFFNQTKPDVIIHLAAKVGGIGANSKQPGEFFYSNMKMTMNVIEAAKQAKCKKFILIGSVCAYPKTPPTIPFREEEIWSGYPEETNAPYGIAKRASMIMLQAYRQQYGLNSVTILPTNSYGPNDSYEDSGHVIPAIIRKIITAQQNNEDKVVLWGTGKATRDFMYVDDFSDGIIAVMEKYNEPSPINIGSGREVSIREVSKEIALILKYDGKIVFDKSKPDGQPRRVLNINKAKILLGFTTKVSLHDGLERTIKSYQGTIV